MILDVVPCVARLTHYTTSGQIIHNIFRVNQGKSFLHKNCTLQDVHKMKALPGRTVQHSVRLPDRTISAPKFLNEFSYSQNKGEHLLVQLCVRNG